VRSLGREEKIMADNFEFLPIFGGLWSKGSQSCSLSYMWPKLSSPIPRLHGCVCSTSEILLRCRSCSGPA